MQEGTDPATATRNDRRSPDAEAAHRLAAPRERAEGAESERGISYPGSARVLRDSHPEGTVSESIGSETWNQFWARPPKSGETIANGVMNRVVTGARLGGWARASGAASHS